MAYNATITVTLAISGTNPSGGGAINEQTVALAPTYDGIDQ